MLLNYNKKVQRIVRILESMITGDGWIAIKQLSHINDCTERTIYNDVNYLVKNWGHMIPLDISHTHIVYPKSAIGNIQYVRERILANQGITKLMKLIIEKPHNSIEFYAGQINLGVQSTRYMLSDLEKSLSLYDIELNTKTKKIYIHGDELRVRYFCATFYYLFQRCFKLEPSSVEHGVTVNYYMKNHAILSRYLRYIEQVSILRFKSGFKMKSQVVKWDLENDVNATLLEYIDTLSLEDERIKPYDKELFGTIEAMGYAIEPRDTNRVRMILAMITFMYHEIYSVKDIRINTATLFILNYSKVNCERFKSNEMRLLSVLSNFTKDAQAVMSPFLFTLDSLFPLDHEKYSSRYVIFSGTSHEHSKAVARYMDDYFPNNMYIVYDGKTELQIPRSDDLYSFCEKHRCVGIISTIGFPYKLDIPTLTVSDYFVGSDIGRIFDFINETCHQEITF